MLSRTVESGQNQRNGGHFGLRRTKSHQMESGPGYLSASPCYLSVCFPPVCVGECVINPIFSSSCLVIHLVRAQIPCIRAGGKSMAGRVHPTLLFPLTRHKRKYSFTSDIDIQPPSWDISLFLAQHKVAASFLRNNSRGIYFNSIQILVHCQSKTEISISVNKKC